ncbi:major facilitator superfamily domain-containing protein [Entophlyctis helioformis]|nr:major facilitator superfamily domain-containing protein [Entophlyctis helioformis]
MVEYDPQERELVKTLDRKLVPFLAVLYFCVLLDRSVQLHTRITNPRTRAGLERDLHMNEVNFIWSLLSFGIGSIATVLPLTLLVRKVGASNWFCECFVCWGIITASTAGATNWPGFLVTRLLLGIVQSGFVPAILVYVVYFYTKEESATRYSFIVSWATAASSISGLFTHYVSRADGQGGIAGWQWTYIMEGLIGIFMGVVTWLHLPSYPETCHFLSPADRVLASARGRDGEEDDTSLLTTGITKKTREPTYRFHYIQLLDVVKDVRTWLLALAYFLISSALDCLIVLSPEVAATSFDISHLLLRNSTSDQLEVIISDDEDGSLSANLLSTAPYALAGILAWAVAVHSDKTGERAMHAAIPLMLSSTGFGFLAILPPRFPGAGPARYFMGLIPAVCGLIIASPCVVSYAMDGTQGDTTRAARAAITVSFGHAFGIALAGSPDLFRDSNAPTYPMACMVSGIAVGVAAALLLLVRWFNKQEEESMWGKAPGLRRLLNDADEAKAWDVELSNFDFLKSERDDLASDEEGQFGPGSKSKGRAGGSSSGGRRAQTDGGGYGGLWDESDDM